MSEGRKKDGRAGRKRLVDRGKRRRVKGETVWGETNKRNFLADPP